MEAIGNWIKQLRQEIELALDDSRPLPQGTRLEADRVTLTLALPPQDPSGQPGNRLTIEFQVRPADSRQAPFTAAEVRPLRSGPEDLRPLILETAAAVFGPGGFDNSARAEVFCELVSGMEPADVVSALRLIEGNSQPAAALQYPVTRLRQILSFSPLGTENAATRLLQTFEDTSSAELVCILGEAWSFGTHWPGRQS